MSLMQTATYQGQIKHGKKHGTGIFEFPHGSIYLGEWEYDKPHG
jgi:hypothetical protein